MAEFNYFNYFTEIEEYFWQKRGAHLLVSPLDWAIVETWQRAGIPLPAVIKGIDRAFESHARSRRAAGGQPLKSLAYCVDAVIDAAEEEKEAAAGSGPVLPKRAEAADSFSREQVRAFLARNADRLSGSAKAIRNQDEELASRIDDARGRLDRLANLLDAPGSPDLEDLERHLTVIEEKLTIALTSHAPEEFLVDVRREMDRQLSSYRRRMTPTQLAQLERQYMQKRVWERYNLPRLSLFYLS